MKRNIFRLDESITSYKYPIAKTLSCIIVISVLFFVMFNKDIANLITNKFIDYATRALSIVIFLACVLCIYISGAELILVSENRAKRKPLSDKAISNSKEYEIDKIISLAESNDIIEIKIVSGQKSLEIGTSSYSESAYSKLTDKRYYVDKKEFSDIEDFRSALLPYLINDKLLVISIDGIAAKKFKN